MLYKRMYFRNEAELAKVRLFIKKMRLSEDLRVMGSDLESIQEIAEDSSVSEQLPEPKKEITFDDLPYSCKKIVSYFGYDRELGLKAYLKWKNMVDSAGDGVVVEKSFEDFIKEMANG